MPGRNPFRVDPGANTIFTAAGAFKDQLQQVELRHAQALQKGEGLRNKKTELLEVLRVFELIEDSERAKTKELEEEVAQAENNARDSPALCGSNSSWTSIPLGDDGTSGAASKVLQSDKGREQGTQGLFGQFHRISSTYVLVDDCFLAYRIGALADVPSGPHKNTVPEFCKQIINSMLPDPNSIEKYATNENAEDTDFYNVGPLAPLIPKQSKPSRNKSVKNAVALKKAKQKAAEHWKAMPHKARRKRRSTSGYAVKSPLAYVTAKEAIKTVAGGLGMSGGLWNSQQQKTKVPETWPNVLQSCMFNIGENA